MDIKMINVPAPQAVLTAEGVHRVPSGRTVKWRVADGALVVAYQDTGETVCIVPLVALTAAASIAR